MPDAQPPRPTRSLARRLVLSSLVVLAVVALLVGWARRSRYRPAPVRAATAVGDSTCLTCHADKAAYERTAHRLTSRPASAATVAGSVRDGENALRVPAAGVRYHVHADASGVYETAVLAGPRDTVARTERMAYVTGSGRKGQSYLFWSSDRLFQLPVSYWTSLRSWIISPGQAYVNGTAGFDRAVAPRCLECHATWIESVPELDVPNHYRADGAILGITCERCHAAGRQHVARERSMLRALRTIPGPATVNPARLDRERQIEVCGQCHGGLGQPKAPAFSYVAGRRLDAYLSLAPQPHDSTVDVHGNQVALLARSRCFAASQMTCATCHDVHRTQRDVAALSGRCLTCHTERSCGLFATRGHALAGRCVDCHMPLQPSRLVVSAFQGKEERVRVRTHWIRVYRDSASR